MCFQSHAHAAIPYPGLSRGTIHRGQILASFPLSIHGPTMPGSSQPSSRWRCMRLGTVVNVAAQEQGTRMAYRTSRKALHPHPWQKILGKEVKVLLNRWQKFHVTPVFFSPGVSLAHPSCLFPPRKHRDSPAACAGCRFPACTLEVPNQERGKHPSKSRLLYRP